MELLGISSLNILMAEVSADVLIPNRWYFKDKQEWFSHLYAQCVQRSRKPSCKYNANLLDRTLLLNDIDSLENITEFSAPRRVALLGYSRNATEQDLQDMIRVQMKLPSLYCCTHKSAFYILIEYETCVSYDKALHQVFAKRKLPLQTCMLHLCELQNTQMQVNLVEVV